MGGLQLDFQRRLHAERDCVPPHRQERRGARRSCATSCRWSAWATGSARRSPGIYEEVFSSDRVPRSAAAASRTAIPSGASAVADAWLRGIHGVGSAAAVRLCTCVAAGRSRSRKAPAFRFAQDPAGPPPRRPDPPKKRSPPKRRNPPGRQKLPQRRQSAPGNPPRSNPRASAKKSRTTHKSVHCPSLARSFDLFIFYQGGDLPCCQSRKLWQCCWPADRAAVSVC